MVKVIDERSLDIIQASELKVGEYFIYGEELYIATDDMEIYETKSDDNDKPKRIKCVFLEDGKVYSINGTEKVSKVDVSISIHNLGALNNDK
jgi:hypothetical protein